LAQASEHFLSQMSIIGLSNCNTGICRPDNGAAVLGWAASKSGKECNSGTVAGIRNCLLERLDEAS
jgi:hypothetical protein